MIFIRYLGESLLDSPLKLKRDPFTIGASAVAGGASIGNNLLSLAHSDIANKKARQWMEDMYNKYSSPAAMMRQYKEAGVNPYLAGSSLGQGMSAQSQGLAPNLSDPGQAIAGGMSSGSMAAQVNSMVGNQKAEAFQKVSNGVTNLLEKGSPEMAESFLRQMMPELKAAGFDSSQVTQLFNAQIQEWNSRNTILGIEASWQKEYGFDYRSTQYMALERSIDLMVGQANVLQTTGELNRAQAQELGSRIGRNIAEAFKLTKEGDYYRANAATADKIRKYLVNQMILSNGEAATAFLRAKLAYGTEAAGAELKRDIASSPWLQWGTAVLEGVGNVVHVGVGLNANYNWGNTKSMVRSVSTSNSTNYNMSNSTSDVYMHGDRHENYDHYRYMFVGQ